MAVLPKNLSSLALDEHERACLEFLVISNDKALFQTVAMAVASVHGKLNCAATAAMAHDLTAQRRMDGIVVDMAFPGALEMLKWVRGSSVNRSSVIFACLSSEPETQLAVHAGANFVLRQPLLPERVAHVFATGVPMMVAEKRQYFRYPLMIPVELKIREREVESTMSNLSEGGMAIWSLFYQAPGTTIHFAFELPFGGLVCGDGYVAWSSGDGLAGIKFHALSDEATRQLTAWIQRRVKSGV
ncbi:MAG TPA: PilZ domain-containing protein [Candidatus Angelobacter sp.]|nr:PilZ domain-containing protein [Candidatus Angelobacter sp.]